MATAGFNLHTGPEPPVSNQAQGAEYGLPDTQIKGEGGAVRVQVPADLADRFEAAK